MDFQLYSLGAALVFHEIFFPESLSKKDLAISNAELEGDEREAKLLLRTKILDLANTVATKVLGYKTEIKEIDEDIVNSCMN